MKPRISLITLGVQDIVRARRFYEKGLGFQASEASNENVTFFKTNGCILGLYSRAALAEDAHIPAQGTGFSGVSIAHNVAEKSEVAQILALAESAGAKIVKPAQDVFWGGHSGYFSDPDGHLWEVAWNPHFPFNPDGSLKLP